MIKIKDAIIGGIAILALTLSVINLFHPQALSSRADGGCTTRDGSGCTNRKDCEDNGHSWIPEEEIGGPYCSTMLGFEN